MALRTWRFEQVTSPVDSAMRCCIAFYDSSRSQDQAVTAVESGGDEILRHKYRESVKHAQKPSILDLKLQLRPYSCTKTKGATMTSLKRLLMSRMIPEMQD